MFYKANCPHCQDTKIADSQNYLNYHFGGKHETPGCLLSLGHLLMLVVTGGFWVLFLVVLGLHYGTRYFCVECHTRISESDIVL
jgi:hypothetical protein